MDRLVFLSAVHGILGIIITVMGIMGLFGLLNMGYEPAWHAIIKILVGISIIGVGIYFTKLYISSKNA
ncbi:hypothetical protein [Methanobacterium alcaliphilum]|uniref:hypothetical protein n=1 Tax=Methanobacterium alcaliphilum TaxID=392018 RepID=UPI002009E2F3|nr:hypothetical protein [Methanobacterium alcaliphilum]MCK9152018.1 hypothetical protein [Methanobacterium alcaliphilum]